MDLYHAYEDHKGWGDTFFYDAREAAIFAGETRGRRLDSVKVLDIGFGGGSFMAWARDQGAEVTGIEINPAQVARAQAQGFDAHAGTLASANTLDGRKFDLIVAFDVLEHIDRDELGALLARVAEHLAPNGRFLARFPNGQSPAGQVLQAGDITHRTALSVPAIAQLAPHAGLVLVRGGNSFRQVTGNPLHQAFQRLRYLLRDLIEVAFSLIYSTGRWPMDATVTVMLAKPDDNPE